MTGSSELLFGASTRRRFVAGAAAGAAGLGLYGAGLRPALADLAAAGDWKKFKGTQLRLLLNNHWWTDAIKAKVGDFEALTGMTLTLDVLSEDNYYQKAAVELSSGTGNYDGLMVGNLQAGQYMAAGWLAPLGDLIGKVVDPGWFKMDDIFKSGRDAGTGKGSLLALPISTEAEVLMYRTDLLKAAGLGPIRTFDELTAAATAMNRNGVAGIVGRGRRGLDVVWVWTGFFLGLGGEFLVNGAPAVDSDAGVAATDLYINKLLKANGPQGTANMSWLEASGVFKEGKAAIYPDASGLVAVVIDKKTNRDAEQVGVFAWPAAAGKAPAPDYWFWLFGIPAASKQQEAAALFTAWATSPDIELAIGRKTGSPVARASVWSDAGFKRFYPGDMAAEISKNSDIRPAGARPVWRPALPQRRRCPLGRTGQCADRIEGRRHRHEGCKNRNDAGDAVAPPHRLAATGAAGRPSCFSPASGRPGGSASRAAVPPKDPPGSGFRSGAGWPPLPRGGPPREPSRRPLDGRAEIVPRRRRAARRGACRPPRCGQPGPGSPAAPVCSWYLAPATGPVARMPELKGPAVRMPMPRAAQSGSSRSSAACSSSV